MGFLRSMYHTLIDFILYQEVEFIAEAGKQNQFYGELYDACFKLQNEKSIILGGGGKSMAQCITLMLKVAL